MKRRLVSFLVVFSLVLSSVGYAGNDKADVIILFENDVHCSLDGYASIAALKADMSAEAEYVGVVSSGDYIQGGTFGIISRGEYTIDLMNMVGYDAVTLGNHEFDYRIPRLFELKEKLTADVVSCNIKTLPNEKPLFDPYVIVGYGDTAVAYVGITTPATLTSSSPAQFLDENGEYKYSFSSTDLYETVQAAIDSAKADGADYIIGLTHLGTEYEKEEWMAQAVVGATEGFDAVLDGHSHSVVEGMTVKDKNGDSVIIASTGTAFENIGKLTIDDGKISTELIPAETYDKKDAKVAEYIENIKTNYSTLGDRKIAESKVKLITHDESGNRIIRHSETNLGNLCSDAFRLVTGADIGFMNGGGIRAEIEAGEVTFNDILNVFPYNNSVCVAEVTGQQVLDMLELGVMTCPQESGGYQHISGLRYDLDTGIESSVVLDENENFIKVDGEYRIRNLEILKDGEYQPIDLNGTYTLASHSYLLLEKGNGATMFSGVKVEDLGILDVEMLETYITENLGGVIGEEYRTSQGRTNIVDKYIPLRKTFESMNYEVIWTEAEPKKIVVKSADCEFIFMADTFDVTIDGELYESDRMAYIENGVTYISEDCIAACTR